MFAWFYIYVPFYLYMDLYRFEGIKAISQKEQRLQCSCRALLPKMAPEPFAVNAGLLFGSSLLQRKAEGGINVADSKKSSKMPGQKVQKSPDFAGD